MSILARSARNFGVQIAGLFVNLADRVILTALLIRAWGVSTFSDWATLLAASGMLAMIDLGFQVYLGNTLSRARGKERPRAFARVLRLGFTFYLVVGLVVVGVIAATTASFGVKDMFGLNRSDMTVVFILLALQQTLRVVRSAAAQVYRAMGETHRLLWVDVRATGLGILLTLGAVSLSASPLQVAMIYFAVELIFGTGLTFHDVRRRYPGTRYWPSRPTRRTVVGAGRVLQWYGLFQVASYGVSNLPVLIGAWLGLGGPLLVSFVVQRTLVNIARTTGSTLSNAVSVELAALEGGRRPDGYQAGMLTLAHMNGALAGVIASGLVFFGGAVVGIWTGRPELGSLLILSLLLVPLFFVAPAVPVQMVATFSGLMRPLGFASLLQVVLIAAGAALAGRAFGIAGVAALLAFAEILAVAIVTPALTARELGVDYARLAIGAWKAAAIALVWSSAVAAGLTWAWDSPTVIAVGIKLVAWGLFGALPALWFGQSATARDQVRGFAWSRLPLLRRA